MLRRSALVHALSCAAGLGAVGCARADRLRLGTHPWIGYEPLHLAHDFGWIDDRVELVMGRSATDSIDALVRGRLDGATLTLDEVLSTRAAGVPLSVVLVLDVSAGADMVVARADVAGLQDLRGRRLGVERSAVGELMRIKTLEYAGLAEHEVEFVDMPVDAQPTAWRAGRIDAAVTYEPTASRLLRDGAHRLFDSRLLPETIFDVLAVRRDAATAAPGLVRAAVQAHLGGLQHVRTHRADALHRVAARQQLDVNDVRSAFGGISLPDLARNRALLGPGARLRESARALTALMLHHRMLPRNDDLTDVVDDRHLPLREARS